MSENNETKAGPVRPKAPEFTTERFYVEHVHRHGRELLMRHVRRYKWAMSYVPRGARVLDVGCGSGYGDFILLNSASHVVGVDIDPDAIEYAKTKARLQKEPRLEYACEDMTQEAGDGAMQFGAVVCIEMFEHVDLEAQAQLLQNVSKWLKPGGVFVMTTPEKGQGAMTKHHVHEVTRSELDAMLSVVFDDVAYDDPAKFGLPDNFILAVCRNQGVRE